MIEPPRWKKTRFGWGGIIGGYTVLTDENDPDSKPYLVDRNGNLISRVDFGDDNLERALQRDYLESELRRPRPEAVKAPVDIEKLARDINYFDWDFDTYGYIDAFDDRGDDGLSYGHELEITESLLSGDIDYLIEGINEDVQYLLEDGEEDTDLCMRGQDIMRRLLLLKPGVPVYDRKSRFGFRSWFRSKRKARK